MNAYCLPGLTLSVCGPPSKLLDAVHANFVLCPRADGAADIVLETVPCYEDEVAAALPGWLRAEVEALGTGTGPMLVCGPGGESAVVWSGADSFSCSWSSAEYDRIWILARRRRGRPSGLSVQTVLTPMLREIFARRGGVMLHSAALRCPCGTGIALMGDGGGGKTTAALSVLRRGAKLLGDDLIVAGEEKGAVVAQGIPEPLNLTEQTIAFFEELRPQEGRSIGRARLNGKVAMMPPEIYGADCIAESCPLEVLYWLRIAPGSPRVEPIPRSEALGHLIRAHSFARRQAIQPAAFDMLCVILARIRMYSLYTGHDPAGLGAWLIERCGGHARGSVD